MAIPRPAALLPALVLAAVLPAAGHAAPAVGVVAPAQVLSGTRFKCDGGGELTAQFASRADQFGAIVDGGDGPHFLPVQPQGAGPVKLTWSDGQRTLTWSPGVQIHWRDGAAQRTCGRRGEGHRH